MPGEDNHFSDATSCHPTEFPEVFAYQERSFISGLSTHVDIVDTMETELATIESQDLFAITWDFVWIESAKYSLIQALINTITSSVSFLKDSLPSDIQHFWKCRNDLCIIDGVVLFKN